MGGFIGDIVDSATDAFEDIVDVVSDAAKDVVEIAESAAKTITDVSMSVTGIKWLDEQLTGGLIYNTIQGAIGNISGTLQGAVEGDWTKFRDGAMGIVTTVVAVAAIVAGAVTGQWWAVAAGVAVLDAQYNEGELLRRTIDIAAQIETAITGTRYIEEYAMEIQMLLTVAATLGAGYVGVPYIVDVSGLGALTAKWAAELEMMRQAIGTGYGLYQIYSAVELIRASQEYWLEQLRAYELALREWMAKAQAAKDQWFDMMTNPNIINRIMPGGDLYSMGAGHDLWSVTNVAEPRYMLGLIDTGDAEMDRMMNDRFYAQAPGTDGFKIN